MSNAADQKTEDGVTSAKKCSLCEGTGIEHDKMCRKCHGNGFVKVAAAAPALTTVAAGESTIPSEDDIEKFLEDFGPSDAAVPEAPAAEDMPGSSPMKPGKVEVGYEGTGEEHPMPLGQASDDKRLRTNIAAMLGASSDKAIDMVFNWAAGIENIPEDQRGTMSKEMGQPSRWKQLEYIYSTIEKMSGEQLLMAYTFVRNTE